MDKFATFIATCGNLGFAKGAPGTYGSLLALPFAWKIMTYGGWWLVIATIAVCLVGWWASHVYSKATAKEDPSEVIIDEVAGQFIAVLPVAFGFVEWWGLLSGFIFFRAFDIAKPFPVGWLDKNIKGGLGIMLDDIAAGVLAGAGLMLVGVYL